MDLHILNETSKLKVVILGTAESNGPVPKIEDCYDPKSIENIVAGTYPKESDMVREMNAFEEVLKKYQVEVYRPEVIKDVNQIFARDIGFVIEDKFIRSNILPNRLEELDAIHHVYEQLDPNDASRSQMSSFISDSVNFISAFRLPCCARLSVYPFPSLFTDHFRPSGNFSDSSSQSYGSNSAIWIRTPKASSGWIKSSFQKSFFTLNPK